METSLAVPLEVVRYVVRDKKEPHPNEYIAEVLLDGPRVEVWRMYKMSGGNNIIVIDQGTEDWYRVYALLAVHKIVKEEV